MPLIVLVNASIGISLLTRTLPGGALDTCLLQDSVNYYAYY